MKKDDHTYWEMSTVKVDDEEIFITKIYSNDMHRQEELHEWMDKNGSKVIKYFVFEQKDSTDEKVNCEITRDEVIKWNMEKGKEIAWEINFKSLIQTGSTVTISKTREAIATSASFSFLGNKYGCILFQDSYQILSSNQTGHSSNEYKYSAASYYAKGIGLVEFHQRFSDGNEKHYKLEKIVSAEEFWKE